MQLHKTWFLKALYFNIVLKRCGYLTHKSVIFVFPVINLTTLLQKRDLKVASKGAVIMDTTVVGVSVKSHPCLAGDVRGGGQNVVVFPESRLSRVSN